MQILLTNDDGIYAPGLAAMERALKDLGDVLVAAPSTEQSGVSQSITFLRPLVGHQVRDGDRLRGYAIDGTPADCVKLAVTQYCDRRPDVIVSGQWRLERWDQHSLFGDGGRRHGRRPVRDTQLRRLSGVG